MAMQNAAIYFPAGADRPDMSAYTGAGWFMHQHMEGFRGSDGQMPLIRSAGDVGVTLAGHVWVEDRGASQQIVMNLDGTEEVFDSFPITGHWESTATFA